MESERLGLGPGFGLGFGLGFELGFGPGFGLGFGLGLELGLWLATSSKGRGAASGELLERLGLRLGWG